MRVIPLLCVPLALALLITIITRAEAPNDNVEDGDSLGLAQGGTKVPELSYAQAEAQLALEETGYLSAIAITVIAGGNELNLLAEDIGAYSNIETVLENYKSGVSSDLTLQYSADKERIMALLEPLREGIDVAAVEPYAVAFLNENNVQRFDVHAGKSGKALDTEATAEAVIAAIAQGNTNQSIEAIIATVAPEMTEAYVKENARKISTFTTRFRDSTMESIANRVYNINKAAGIINCSVIAPGEEWSFNGCVGLRSLEDGWKEAPGITGGKEYSQQAGGGICQVSTTLYNALLLGNINVTDRKAHSIPSDYVDKGLDATVDSGGIDLKFLNDTGAPLYIFAYIKPDPSDDRYSTITVSIYGKPLESGLSYKLRSEITETIEQSKPQYTYSDTVPKGYQLSTVARHDGYVAEVYRDKYINDELVGSELLYTDRYRGNVEEILIGTGDPATVSVPSGAVKVASSSVG